MAKVTRTYGPLHFEDLDAKRFEDLVRQLAYEFRPWRKLEPTGRGGSDDGFDVRGLEIVRADADSDTEAEANDQELDNDVSDRLWLIQCKRERSIGPAKLVQYLSQYSLQDSERLYGLIFAAACDFSKTARDSFNETCRQQGILEFLLWGKGELEDLLFQPKNDHLLFAYFGFSITIRQRSRRTALRSLVATKKRLKSVTTADNNGTLAIRNSEGDIYPRLAKSGRFADEQWRLCPFEELRHDGLEIEWASYHAFMDNGPVWDAADAAGLHRSQLYLGEWPRKARENPDYDAAGTVWNSFDEDKRAWLSIRIIIPYDRIIAIDDVGDEYFAGPQIYCRYVNGLPNEGMYSLVESVQRFGRQGFWVDGPSDPNRIVKFPDEFRLNIAKDAKDVTGRKRRS